MPDESSTDVHGVIVMCMHCRRTLQKATDGEKWELIEQYLVHRPENVSDGLCRDSLVKHYPGK
jgi:hypothetical protein